VLLLFALYGNPLTSISALGSASKLLMSRLLAPCPEIQANWRLRYFVADFTFLVHQFNLAFLGG